MIVHNLLERNIRITNARCYDLEESMVDEELNGAVIVCQSL